MRMLGSRRTGGVLTVAVLALVTRAEATVTQVDGTIVPANLSMQDALDTYEPPAGSLDEVKDAAEVPQIFRPRLSSPVVFLDIRETAGFEDSFGWYNVGDDVSTAAGRNANLHPVMGCGVPMVNGAGDAKTHSGNPAFYVRDAEEPDTISVNFAAEALAGRYKGGFIGFYLITPEDLASPTNPLPGRAINCGDFKQDATGKSLFGFIYFTQKDLNNDGDFVHHVAYRSRVTDRFFFGFEDLFRGGDNDFEDMALRIDGLTPPCVPSAEVCDGVDNDCDGLIDAADPDLPGTGTSCLCDDVAQVCDNGPRFGQCRTGVTACTAGAITCHGTGTPSGEVCDGLDNNCNNLVDDNPTGIGGSCDGVDADLCREGQIVCTAGALVCNDTTAANVETCNNFDDNCDGRVDEGDPGGGAPCGSSLGVCTPGTFHCIGGTLLCQGGNAGGPERCNGLDDNCDGVVDDNPTDVGVSCGATSVGECALGQTICVGGSLSCAGEIGPGVERCNGLDDDCDNVVDDNPVDAGQPCGSSIGACRPGVFVCTMGGLVCTGGTGPTAETCNGIDDDCNGIVDDSVPGEGVACGTGTGPCGGAMTRCIAGSMQCVGGTSGGTEVCNGVDDDCDGIIDNGDLCNGGVCDHGQCASPCLPGEFPCPSGKRCNMNNNCVDDPCYGITCANDAQGNLQSCRNGACEAACLTVDCPSGLVCRGRDGACVLDTCDYLPKCSAAEICVDSTCQANPCKDVTCPGDGFCRGGTCVASCQGVRCGATQECRDGACVATGCAVDCGDGVCNPELGACQNNRCSGVLCPQSKACEPLTGRCIADACQGVTCPSGQTCSLGQCDGGPRGGLVTTGGGGGCNTGGDGSLGAGLAVLALALVRSARGRRRRWGRGPAIAVTAALALTGCKINDYCLECETNNGNGDGGTRDGGSGDDGGGTTCDPNQSHPETCNHLDDNCDGQIDEGFDLQGDEMNCGACGVACNKPGAQTQCVSGACTITGCYPGFTDKNGDITGPYGSSDGCEYTCFQSNNGVEACDGLDNNCNGTVDEGIDKTSDPNNCGMCGRTCQFFGATGHCVSSTCQFDPATDCQPGFHDIDGLPLNGCEYQCTPSNGGVEACDVRDNNCNGAVDEGFNFASDPANCGRCGFTCQFAHATASCAAGGCRFDPVTDCQPGFVDANRRQLDGCEYLCTRTNGGVEVCDGVDNDCNGVADDNPIDAGAACASTTPPRGACAANGTLSCAAGRLVCSGATEAAAETCNNADDDCDGSVDDGVTQVCYTGAAGTSGIGVCHPGFATCAAGAFGACASEVTPSAEQCNNLDDDCNGAIDDPPGGGVITQVCYGGPPGTAGIGTCKSGNQTCAFGAFGGCAGEVRPALRDVCGDGLDTDCDGKDDAAEGCQVLDAEIRLDAPGGALGETTAGTRHSYDVVLARGGVPLGTNVYAAWSQLVGTQTEVFLRKSTDGGKTWGTIVSVTRNAGNKVKPALAIAPGATDRVVVAFQTVTAGVRDIRVQISTNGGTTFGNASAALDASGDSFHHTVAISGTTCVVAWEKLDTTTLNRDVMSRTSSNGCTTFNAETKINVGSPATRFAGRPQVGITSTGGIVWAWREQRGNPTRDIFAAAAPNTTTAPTTDVRIDGDTTGQRESDFPVLVVNETAAYLVWQDVSTISNNGSDAMFARSTDSGVTWGAERIIDDAASEVSSSFTPSLAIDPKAAGIADDLVAIAWEDRRQGTQVFTSVSSDGGASFAAPVRASSDVNAPVTGQTSVPQIAAAGTGVLAVVYQNQQTTGRPHVFVATSVDTGATWTFSEFRADAGAGSAIVPQVIASQVAGRSAAVAAWTDFRTNQINGDIYVALSH
jgi:Notch 1